MSAGSSAAAPSRPCPNGERVSAASGAPRLQRPLMGSDVTRRPLSRLGKPALVPAEFRINCRRTLNSPPPGCAINRVTSQTMAGQTAGLRPQPIENKHTHCSPEAGCRCQTHGHWADGSVTATMATTICLDGTDGFNLKQCRDRNSWGFRLSRCCFPAFIQSIGAKLPLFSPPARYCGGVQSSAV